MSALGQERTSRPSDQCPLYPQKRTSELSRGMSALCQKRTHALQQIPGPGDDPAGLTTGRTVATALASAKPASGSAKLHVVRRRHACDDCSRLGLSRVCPSASNYQLISTPIIIGAWIDIDWLNNGRRRNPIAFGSHALRVDGVKSRLQ